MAIVAPAVAVAQGLKLAETYRNHGHVSGCARQSDPLKRCQPRKNHGKLVSVSCHGHHCKSRPSLHLTNAQRSCVRNSQVEDSRVAPRHCMVFKDFLVRALRFFSEWASSQVRGEIHGSGWPSNKRSETWTVSGQKCGGIHCQLTQIEESYDVS